MKQLIFMFFIGLAPFTGFANTYEETHYIHFELNSERIALWTEMTFKESVLSAISVMEETNEALGLNNYDPPVKQIIAIPIAMGALAATFGLTKAAQRPLQKLPDGEQLEIFNRKHGRLTEEISKFDDTLDFYQEKVKSHPLDWSDFSNEIETLSKEELQIKKDALAKQINDLENSLETKHTMPKIIKQINELKAQIEYIDLHEAKLNYSGKITQAETDLKTLIKEQKPGFVYRLHYLARQMGMGAIFTAAIGAHSFIAMDVLYITLDDDEVLEIKERYSKDIKNIKQLLL